MHRSCLTPDLVELKKKGIWLVNFLSVSLIVYQPLFVFYL